MKKLILAAAAASILAVPAAAAPYGRYDNGRQQVRHEQTRVVTRNDRGRQVVKVRQVQSRKWQRGQRFDNRYASNYRVISNPRAYRLHDAPRGYRWVQSGNDAVLVAVVSGLIGAVLANAF
ncbi:MAG: hypothetical protein E6G94_00020 [Alphaproteobacteria bacterium]|nr:MAG: hypothetical protein E6G94_00020 [Alphaproteobacteria bacterium]